MTALLHAQPGYQAGLQGGVDAIGRSAAAVSVAAAFGQTGVAVSIGVSIARNAVDNNVLADVSNVTLVSLEDTTQGNPLVIEAVTGAGNLPNSIATDDNLTFAGLDAASKADDPEANPTAANDDIKTLRALKVALEGVGSGLDRVLHLTIYLTDMAERPGFNPNRRRRPI